ncbi:MAG: hypothetical protein M1814_002272 [Vezdaea aestivalis]|nr:MAG: hypothetical protein M1814_002272 [Vezdaea aestivalis]
MPSKLLPILTEEEVDDILCSSRANDLETLGAEVSRLSSHYNVTAARIISLAQANYNSNTALHMSAANGHIAILTSLLAYIQSSPPDRSVIDQQNAAGSTPLHYAALNGKCDAVDLLLSAGADPNVKNKNGRTARNEAEMSASLADEEEGAEGGRWDIVGRLALRESEDKVATASNQQSNRETTLEL